VLLGLVTQSRISREPAAQTAGDVATDIVSMRVGRFASLRQYHKRDAEVVVISRLCSIELDRFAKVMNRSMKVVPVEAAPAPSIVLVREANRIVIRLGDTRDGNVLNQRTSASG
jgi:hypothetical protein